VALSNANVLSDPTTKNGCWGSIDDVIVAVEAALSSTQLMVPLNVLARGAFSSASLTVQGGAAIGQQTSEMGFAQPCGIESRSPKGGINRAIVRGSSPTVVTPEVACHAGGRGF
jgi:hypothetical protein